MKHLAVAKKRQQAADKVVALSDGYDQSIKKTPVETEDLRAESADLRAESEDLRAESEAMRAE